MADLKLKILVEAMDRISAPFRRASQSTGQLKTALKAATDNVRSMEKASAQIEAFGRLKNDAMANAAALGAAQQKAQALGRGLAEAGGGAKKAQAQFAAARREVNRLETAQVSIARETEILRRRLGEAGVDTRNLAAGQRKLRQDLDAARQAATKQASALDAMRTKTEALSKARAKLSATRELQGRMAMGGGMALAAGSGALMAGAPVVNAAGDFQHQLAAYGLTAGQTGAELDTVREKIRAVSETVNQSATNMLAIQAILVGKGMNPDQALASLDVIGRAVTGTGAAYEDMGNLAFSVMDNLKVPQDQLTAAFDIMGKAGDLGGFELKNMANTFPQLTASASMLGMTGTKAIGTLAAALQIATKGAASPEQAANNFANFLQKATSPDTVKNFEKKGIDIKAALQKGLMAGEDPLDVMMKSIGQAVGVDFEKEISGAVAAGGNAQQAAEQLAAKFNLGELFGDAQVQNFLSPMMANMQEFRRIRDETMNSAGTVDGKFRVMMDTFNESTRGLGTSWGNMMEGIGQTVLPVLTPMVQGLRSVVQGVSSFATENPRLTATLVIVAGALAFLVAAGGALTLAIAGMLGPFALARFALTAIGFQGGVAAGALSLLRGGFGLLAGAASSLFPMLMTGIRAVGMAFMANPIGLAIAGIAAAAALIYVYWEPIKAFFAGLWGGIASAFSAAWDIILSGIAAIKAPLAAISGVFGKLFGGGSSAEAAAPQTARAAPIKVASTAVAAAAVAAPMAMAAPPPAAAPVNMGGVTIVVNAAPGQSETEIAKAVRAELDKWQARQRTDARSRLYDEEK